MGISQESDLPLTWGGDAGNILWQTPLPGIANEAKQDHNQSSPIVWRDRVFVTTACWPASSSQSDVPEQHVACYRATTGELLWDTLVPAGPWKLSDLRGGYAAPTPVTDGQRVYVSFGSSVLAALDWDGRLNWHKELPDWQAVDVAMASSPILCGGQLLLLSDKNQQKSTLTAFDPQSGEVLWEQKRPQSAFDHTTPVVIRHAGRGQLLVAASNELQALDPTSGDRLWWCKTAGDVTSPVYAGGFIYTDSGRGGAGILVDAGGSGDVTESHIKWKTQRMPEGLSSPVIVGDFLYRLHNPGVLKCFRLANGEEVYATRLDGVSVASSPIATPAGRIYFASAGKTFVVQAGPKYELLATNNLGEPTSASAAASAGKLFLKGQRHLYCVAMMAPTAKKASWQPISDEVVSKLKPGYPGKTAGVTVDPATGDVYMVVPDQGMWKSTDRGESFVRIDGGKVGGRCETGFALNFDPAGKRLMCFMIYGSSALTNDAGETWTASKSSHLDFGAVDWGGSARAFLALRHESGGLLTLSTDAGQSWRDLQKGFTHLGLFNDKILVASKGTGIERSADGGATWSSVSDATPTASVMVLRQGVGYWLTDKGLLTSRDQGQTWQTLGSPVTAIVGPMWGQSEKHMVVVGKTGFLETLDGGQSWQAAAPLPEGFRVGGVGPNYAWDPIGNVFYASSMGKDTLRYQR